MLRNNQDMLWLKNKRASQFSVFPYSGLSATRNAVRLHERVKKRRRDFIFRYFFPRINDTRRARTKTATDDHPINWINKSRAQLEYFYAHIICRMPIRFELFSLPLWFRFSAFASLVASLPLPSWSASDSKSLRMQRERERIRETITRLLLDDLSCKWILGPRVVFLCRFVYLR